MNKFTNRSIKFKLVYQTCFCSQRFWYSDNDLTAEQKKYGCKDISQQLFDLRHHMQVVMGGGRLHMVPNDEVMPGSSKKGKRRDGQNLMRMWEEEMSKKNGRFEKFV